MKMENRREEREGAWERKNSKGMDRKGWKAERIL